MKIAHRVGISPPQLGLLLLCASSAASMAAMTDISTVPLASGSSSSALPNVMFILDNSGSMALDFLPDDVASSHTCKNRVDTSNDCRAGDPPYYSGQFNTIYYNPALTYSPPVYFDGTSYPAQSDPTKVSTDPFLLSTTTNIATGYPELVYCKNLSYDPAAAANYPANCRRNGYLNTAALATTTTTAFLYPVDTTSNHGSNAAAMETYPSATYTTARTLSGAPFYYAIAAREHCSDQDLVNCALAAAPSGSNIYPAPVRWCKTSANANSTTAVTGSSGGSPRCQLKPDSSHAYPRYGTMSRVNIVTGASYAKASTRTDCAGATCSYTEEITNFGNWYAYYRTRMQMMKTAAGRGFSTLDDRYRVGFITINTGSPVASDKYLPIDKFNSIHKKDWYDKFYSQTTGGNTPLREALSRVGRHYAGKKGGINSGMDEDPVQYSCQQNFALLTTDGYWNSNAGVGLGGAAIGNQDNVDLATAPKWSARANGTYDGALSGASDTLADVALYYYKTDLRPSGSTGALGTDVSKPNVPTTAKDFNAEQHMTTFTLGLVDGTINYRSDYESSTAADNPFYRIRTGDKGCAWNGGGGATCDWPLPAKDTATAIDDLWHAAVNGRGSYYSARDPKSLSEGISGALVSLGTSVAAASASATSSPNITPTDNAIYSSTYTTVEWAGEVVSQSIDTTTGAVIATINWSAQAALDAATGASTDSRTLYMRDPAAANGLKAFKYASMTATEQAYFKNKCTPAAWSQCSTLSAADLALANDGTNVVNFLRGQTQYEATLFRDRAHVLGDTVNAKPVYVRQPMWNFTDIVDPTYGKFKSDNASRKGVLYIAANDGMLHALDGDLGSELWAFVPSMVLPEMYKLAETKYAIQHKYFVDGSPEVMDVWDGSGWRTLLVGGLNSGGRGYYALDITSPTSPKSLWDFCTAGCISTDSDLGLTYGNPVITKRASDGKWVVLVTSGYNNVSPGDGKGYLYVLDAITGAKLDKIATGAGSTTAPSGLARISAWADSFATDNTAKYVYGGDLLGNFWRFDMSAGSAARLATLVDGGGKPQPVTTRPELGSIDSHRIVHIGTGRYLGNSDLSDPATLIPASGDAYQQSLYTFKDKGSDYGDLRDDLVKQDITVLSATTRSTSTNGVDLSTQDGWYVDFNPGGGSPGERVNIDPQLILGTLVVVTNVPSGDACSLGGDSWIYYFDYRNGQYVNTSPGEVAGKKLGNAITVGAVVFQLPSGTKKGIATDAKGNKQSLDIPIGSAAAKAKRTSWRELIR